MLTAYVSLITYAHSPAPMENKFSEETYVVTFRFWHEWDHLDYLSTSIGFTLFRLFTLPVQSWSDN